MKKIICIGILGKEGRIVCVEGMNMEEDQDLLLPEDC